jgi:hypothetical protein
MFNHGSQSPTGFTSEYEEKLLTTTPRISVNYIEFKTTLLLTNSMEHSLSSKADSFSASKEITHLFNGIC